MNICNTLSVALVAMLTMPVIAAAPNAQTGSQTGAFWNEYTTVAVQGGTGYELRGIAGDHDIRFYNAAGWYVGGAFNCGDDAGRVPSSAVTARIYVWDHDGAVFPCQGSALDAAPASQWVYIDGL